MKSALSVLFFIIFLTTSLTSQELIKTKRQVVHAENGLVTVIYFTLKKDMAIKQGPYNYFINDKSVIQGYFKDNKRDSLWVFNYPDDITRIKGNYKDGQRNGVWSTYFDVVKASDTYYNAGVRDSSVSYHSNNQLLSKQTFLGDERHGTFNIYNPDGTPVVISTYNYGDLNGIYREYYPNNKVFKELIYTNGYIDSTARIYFAGGQILLESIFDKGKLINIVQFNNKDGSKVKYGNFHEGKGILKSFYFDTENDELSKSVSCIIEFNEGYANGGAVYFDKEGKMAQKGKFKENRKTGLWKKQMTPRDYIEIDYDDPFTDNELTNLRMEDLFISTSDEMMIFRYDRMPDFPGSEKGLYYYLANNMDYPVTAAEQGIQGRVYLSFKISDLGEVGDIKVITGVHPDIDREAIRVISDMPLWKPGFSNNIPVDVVYYLPLKFTFQ